MNMDLSRYRYFLIVDLEATCCNKQSIARNEMEIIEIGAVMVEAETLSVVDEFTTFVRPVRKPLLTAFCTELTSICQADVNGAPVYPAAIKQFKAWLYQYESFLFCSWGDYDKAQLHQDSQFHKVSYPIGTEHINIKKLFSLNQNLKKKYGMAGALTLSGLSLDGTHHRGIDDARNMARLMPFVLGRRPVLKQSVASQRRV
ncbi:exonuclease domain-containing protein [Microbulbifer sp. OS29]|uniref:Exonuclease domain-containing protein n=1 Tax=Microbulbifer okhotskensis TaxID=2926617 RepID=A0A9X2EP49_9GAMM|nr:3'-5' exonuclease [Microbulbifer okhotskensis]MCO1335857.1 exonuclease domain-containing protein [Microbulbifer okhotskensis]